MKEYFYVIMPLSTDTEWTLKREIIEKASYEHRLKAHFPFEGNQDNSNNVFSEVAGSVFVFADVSFERPSCYYELGIAQALRKATFIVARSGTPIHQCKGDVHYYVSLIEYEELVRKALNPANGEQ